MFCYFNLLCIMMEWFYGEYVRWEVFFMMVFNTSSAFPFGLSLQLGVATAYHHSPNLSVFNIRFLCINFPHIFFYYVHLKIFSLVSLFSSFLVTPFPSFSSYILLVSPHDMSLPPQAAFPHFHS